MIYTVPDDSRILLQDPTEISLYNLSTSECRNTPQVMEGTMIAAKNKTGLRE